MNHILKKERKQRKEPEATNLAGHAVCLALLTIASLWGFPFSGGAQDHPAAGPAIQTFDLTLEPGTRTEIAGPLYYHQKSESEQTWAWPPFYSRYEDSLGSCEKDFLYPLLTYEAHGEEYRWQFIELFSFAGGANPDGGGAKRTTVYPFYFKQRSTDTNDDYTAVLPFYGHIKHRLLLNDVFFVMFPLYSETKNKGYVTDNYLYPFFHLRHGDNLEGWQFWPLIGKEHKDITSATNGFGDISMVPGHDTFFTLWPIYHQDETDIGADNPEHSLAVIPFYARLRSPRRDSTSVLWPFFTWIDDRGRKYHEWQGPWPFVIFSRGEGKHTDRIWPIFNQSHNTTQEGDSYVWPVYQYHEFHAGPIEQKRERVLFYIYENTVNLNTETGKYKRRVDMWPFFTWHRDEAGSTRLQVLSLWEPAVPDNPGIERNYSPIWALWRAENNATNGHHSRSLLWNLYRQETTSAAKNSSLLFGLFQYKQEGGSKQLRCFYGLSFHWH